MAGEKIFVTEFARATKDPRNAVPSAEGPAITTQVIDISGGVAASAVFNAETQLVRVHTNSIASIKFGTAPTAAVTDARMAANQTEYFGIPKEGAGTLKLSGIINT